LLKPSGFWHKKSPASGARDIMTDRLQYGTTAKVFHWLIVALLLVQYPLGWLMPDIHRGMKPGDAMTWHISIGITMLVLIVLRFAWRLTHPVPPESSLPTWRRVGSEAMHWLLYALVLATTITGWLFASFRGWSVSFLFLAPMPMLSAGNPAAGKMIDGWHQAMEWSLLVVIGLHVAAALTHLLVHRDRVMHRMLPG
jgi:cytochrome b561